MWTQIFLTSNNVSFTPTTEGEPGLLWKAPQAPPLSQWASSCTFPLFSLPGLGLGCDWGTCSGRGCLGEQSMAPQDVCSSFYCHCPTLGNTENEPGFQWCHFWGHRIKNFFVCFLTTSIHFLTLNLKRLGSRIFIFFFETSHIFDLFHKHLLSTCSFKAMYMLYLFCRVGRFETQGFCHPDLTVVHSSSRLWRFPQFPLATQLNRPATKVWSDIKRFCSFSRLYQRFNMPF